MDTKKNNADTSFSANPCLVVIDGYDLGCRFDVAQGTTTLGRGVRCEIQIEQESLSRNHAQIDSDGKIVTITDLGSVNGTFVNDQLTEPHTPIRLHNGDLLKVGRTVLKFLAGDNVEQAYQQEVFRLVSLDELTQTYNRRYFLDTTDRELSRAARRRRPLSLVTFCVDSLERIDDEYGHPTSEAVLKELVALVRKHVRSEDVFARYSENQFMLLLPESDRERAHTLAEHVREAVAHGPFGDPAHPISITISVGLAVASLMDDALRLVRRADALLCAAQNAGGNRCLMEKEDAKRSEKPADE